MPDAIDTILQHEGLYQNSKEDSGNYDSNGRLVGTKYGIAAKTLEQHRGKAVTKADMKALTVKEARQIYEEKYAKPLERNLGIKPSHPAYDHLLDMSVNHGYGNVVPMVQRALGVKVDGKAGPETRKALQAAKASQLQNILVNERKGFYNNIVRNDPTQQKFHKGWINRAESFRPQP